MKRILLRLVMLALLGVSVIAVLGRVSAARRAGPVDAWVTPTYHEYPTDPSYDLVQSIEWVAPGQRAGAVALLASAVSVPVDEAALRRMLPGVTPPSGPTGCTTYLVRGLVGPSSETKLTRVHVSGTTIDASVYGGFGCELHQLQRAPFVACLTDQPAAVLTSFRCEPLTAIGWLLSGRGDRW